MTGRRRWWVTGLVAVWALVLVAAAVWSAHHDSATVRGQSGLTEGRITLDRAVATVAEAAGPQVAVDIEPYQLTPDCRLTLARAGTEVDQTVVLTVPEGQEAALLEGLVERLPEQWHARYNPNRNRFFADAGDFVAVRGEVAGPGLVQLTVSTGCRPGDDPQIRG
jgi:hypothetical protein